MNSEVKPIECIADHLLVFDFNYAKELGIVLDKSEYEELKAKNVHISEEGDIWLNTSYKYYPILKENFLQWNLYSLEHLIKLYKKYDSIYPEVIDQINFNDYKTEDELVRAIGKITLRYELLKRERNLPNVQKLLDLLLH